MLNSVHPLSHDKYNMLRYPIMIRYLPVCIKGGTHEWDHLF